MKILVVDDDKRFRDLLVSVLQFEQIAVTFAENGLSAQRKLEEEVFAAVVTDLKMPGIDGLELLRWIQEEGPAIPVIMISGFGGIQDAVLAIKAGAQDYIMKPFDPEVLLVKLRRILENQALKSLVEFGTNEEPTFGDWIGESQSTRELKALVEKIAPTPATVLISGESGTGKEVVARAIHKLSPRAAKPFIAINIGGVPENLLETELFGHEKGAFTGASARKIGIFELASSGTLFLDEIGDIPFHLQGKMLRVLQDKKIQRLGGTHSIPVDARILAATNKDLERLVKAGSFREDMFYRLNVIRIVLPPLRERKEDIPLLVGHFLRKSARRMGKPIHTIEPTAVNTLRHYQFPGNIRELENLIERAVILAETETITLNDLGMAPPPSAFDFPSGSLADIEKQAILKTLTRWEGNRTRAAKALGISRKTLLNKLKLYGIPKASRA